MHTGLSSLGSGGESILGARDTHTHSSHHTLVTPHTRHTTHSSHHTLVTPHTRHTTHSSHHTLVTPHTRHTTHSSHHTLLTPHTPHTTHSSHHTLLTPHTPHTTHSSPCPLTRLCVKSEKAVLENWGLGVAYPFWKKVSFGLL